MLELILGIGVIFILCCVFSGAKADLKRMSKKRREIDAMLAQYERDMRERNANEDEIVGALIRKRQFLDQNWHTGA